MKYPDVVYKQHDVIKKNRPMGIHSLEIIHTKSRMKYLYVYTAEGVVMQPILNADGTPMLATKEEIDQLLREY